MSKTACIVPWSSLVLGPDGRATFCCDAPVPLNVGGRMGRIDRDSLEDLWNSPDLVQVRRGMARGERPGACGVCWEREAAGGVSRRLLTNAAYRQMGGRLAVEELPREGAANGFHLERRPDWFILELGNVCNLKCRSCSALFSSRIAGDPVHEAWTTNARAPAGGSGGAGGARRRLEIVPESASAWWDDIENVADMIASGATDNAMLSLLGGEPFLMARTWRLLSALVARGVAPRLLVALATNGQHRGEGLEELAPRFRGFSLALSIDGHGRLYEYLRHGARWHRLVENLGWFRRLPKVDLMAVPTLQNYNALDMVTLLRFLDEHELRLSYNVVSWPARLRPANLPPSVRRIAARRLRAYLDAECRPANLSVVRGWCEILEEAGEELDAGLFDEFMAFTNDLDADRGESLREAAPELFDLIRAAGVVWPGAGRHSCAGGAWPSLQQEELLRRVNRTVSSRDAIFAGFESVHTGAYFTSGLSQLAEIDSRLREHGHPGLAGCRAIADFGCHYGRFTRAVRAALPHVAVYACDIDAEAVRFCAGELGALPVLTGWKPDEESLPGNLDAVVCISLLTHTPLEHWRRALRAWARMLRPGGVVAFTFLSESHVEAWLAGTMEHYGSYSQQQRDTAVRALREEGCGFASLTSGYGGEPLYGVSFTCTEVVRREIAAAGLELLALPSAVNPAFGQDLALARTPARPTRKTAPEAVSTARTVHRDVTLVALYDPRGYTPAPPMAPTPEVFSGLPAPPDIRDGGYAGGIWSRLAAAYPARSLPTELGFCDPRLAEVREAQAALASEHGVDAFCYLFLWGEAGPRWDAPWRDLLTTGRPDFPFCLMIDLSDGGSLSALSAAAAERLFEVILPGLADRRYLRLEDRALLFVRDAARLVEPRSIAAAWRAAATARGLGGLHLCAVEPVPAEHPSDLGFDSFLEAPAPAGDHVGVAAAALARPWPQHRLLRTVRCRRDRDAGGERGDELYEHWLRSTVDATRRRGEKLVFVEAWNDWLGGLYLEPDDREGRAALMATRRAARGPGSGLVLVRQLGDALGRVEGPAAALLGELRQVLELHEGARDRLLASVEVALGRNPLAGSEALRWVPVASRQLPPSGGGLCLDQVGGAGGPEIQGSREPLVLRGDEVHLAGWAHTGTCAPTEVDLFLALESSTGGADRIFPVAERVARLDVVAAFPGHPARCGFDTVVNLAGLAPGTYSITIVQRTPEATYRDATGVTVRLDGAPCSKG